MMKRETGKVNLTAAETVEMAAHYYRDEFMQICIRMKAFRFHEAALRKELFYDRRDSLAAAYRLDHSWDDLFVEARAIGRIILGLNSMVRKDPYIGRPFLGRRYEIRSMPDPAAATDEEISRIYRDVFSLLEDYENLLFQAEEVKRKEEKSPEGQGTETK